MNNNHRFNHFMIFALILIVGLGFALTLPWLANSQSQAAQSDIELLTSTIYVATTGDGSDPTVGWSTAYTNVQDALGAASGGDEIWVVEGVYYPDEGSGQINNALTSTFMMMDGVALYGGFDTSDEFLTDRDWENNVTVLSGDIDGNDLTDSNGVVITTTNIISDNAYHVVTGSGVTTTAVLDGFTITAGDAQGSFHHDSGGGMYNNKGSPALANVVFSGNSAVFFGGGMFNSNGSSPALTDVVFSGNSASIGGGMSNQGSSPTLTNVTFSGNSAFCFGGGMYNSQESNFFVCALEDDPLQLVVGGGMYNSQESNFFACADANDPLQLVVGGGMYNRSDGSSTELTNVVFSGNSASDSGGGMFNNSSSLALTNVTFSGNSAFCFGGGMYNGGSSLDVRNGIFWNNQANGVTGTYTATILNSSSTVTLTHSLVESSGAPGSWALDSSYIDGGGNIDEDPLFIMDIDPSTAPSTTGNLRLQIGSPAIDAGDNIFVSVSFDLDNQPRVTDGDGDFNEIVDMGAYETSAFDFYELFEPIIFR